MYDLIIIGAGPAGMTAGIYAARKKLKTLLISRDSGGQMVVSGDIENYGGYSVIAGADLAVKFRSQLAALAGDLEFKEGVEVMDLEKNITSFAVTDRTGAVYYGRSVIIASGRKPKKLGIAGEEKFFGRGVSTCATCDAPLYKNKDVAVVGGGNGALDALLTLSKLARRVYSVNIAEDFSGDEILKTKVAAQPNITFYPASRVAEITGEKFVSGIVVSDRHQQERRLAAAGVFVEIGWEPNADFDRITQKNGNNEIKVDQNLQTSVPGVFAAGDINDAWGEQIIIAAGEGAKAALAAADYLNHLKS